MKAFLSIGAFLTILLSQLSVAASSAASPTAGPAGGANQRQSQQVCVGHWAFDGIWRLRVDKVERIHRPFSGDPGTPGYGVTVELKNGTTKNASLFSTGVDGQGNGVDLIGADGNALSLDVGDFQAMLFKSLPQGAILIHQLKFYYPNGTADAQVGKAAKFLLQIDPKSPSLRDAGLAYSTKSPSFRIDLTCPR